MRLFCLAFLSLTLLSGCSDKPIDIKGQQVAVLAGDADLKPEVTGFKISLPAPARNQLWTHTGFNAQHHIPSLSLGGSLAKVFNRSIGSGSSHEHRLLTSPVIGDRLIYTLDARGTVKALDRSTCKTCFSVNTRPKDENIPIGHGGLAYAKGMLYVATGYAELIAINAQTGVMMWRKSLSAPARSAPTYSNGRIYVTTVDNIIASHQASNGEILWTYTGLAENAGLLGTASPAIYQDTLVVPFSSGEVIALLADTGRPLWGEALTTSRRADAVANIATIKAQPVIEGGRVYVVGHAGRMMVFDLRTGDIEWERNIGGTQTPLVLGNTVFVISEKSELFALRKSDGKIIWKTSLPATTKRNKDIHWHGPLLAGGHLILANSCGHLTFVDPYKGQTLQTMDTRNTFELAPLVANNTLYLLSDRGTLIAFR